MKNIRFTITIGIICTMLFSCTGKKTPLLIQTQNTETENHPDEMNDSILIKGRLLAKTECTGCHRIYSPEEYSADEWKGIIREKSRRLSLRKEQIDALDLYFLSESNNSE